MNDRPTDDDLRTLQRDASRPTLEESHAELLAVVREFVRLYGPEGVNASGRPQLYTAACSALLNGEAVK